MAFFKERAPTLAVCLSLYVLLLPSYMIGLCRIAHLTLRKIADTGIVIVAEVSPQNKTGLRMAELVGFSRSKLKNPKIWLEMRN
ncbi:MAG: hypothetical protein U5K75_00025 [Ahrensia sp.]|nr:hypothetical protein [Ahrensia sp.]